MKKLLLILTLLFTINLVDAQPTKPIKPSTETYTYQKKVYPVYIGSRGGKYILVTSKNGNEYKKYLKKD